MKQAGIFYFPACFIFLYKVFICFLKHQFSLKNNKKKVIFQRMEKIFYYRNENMENYYYVGKYLL